MSNNGEADQRDTSGDSRKPKVVSSGPRDAKAALEYWTEEQMKDTKPVQKSVDKDGGDREHSSN